jgi:hypothetical protein
MSKHLEYSLRATGIQYRVLSKEVTYEICIFRNHLESMSEVNTALRGEEYVLIGNLMYSF